MINSQEAPCLENLPSPPKLRRHHAICHSAQLNQRFFDTKTHEIVSGNPDLSHHTNQDLVKIVSWGSGKCIPHAFFFQRKDDKDPHPSMMPVAS